MERNVLRDRDYEIWVLLNQVRDVMFSAREKESQQFGISAMQAGVLFVVRSIGDKATPAEISRWLFRKPHSVSCILSRMEKEGLIRKSKDLERKNLVRIALTDRGEEAYRKSLARESIHRIFSKLTQEECQNLASLLKALRNSALREVGAKDNLPFPESDSQ